MRYSSRVVRMRTSSNVIPIRPRAASDRTQELTAFRGLLVAASASALFWGACWTAVWLILGKD